MNPATVLSALAELAPAGTDRELALNVTKSRYPLWLPDPQRPPRRPETEQLAALDVLHRDERLLRRGWAWLLGTAEVNGRNRKVQLPLLAEPVRLEFARGQYRAVPAGDLELTPLIGDPAVAARLDATPVPQVVLSDPAAGATLAAQAAGAEDIPPGPAAEPPRPLDPAELDELLVAWLQDAANAAGLPAREIWRIRPGRPESYRLAGTGRRFDVEWPPPVPKDWLVALAGAALYVARDVFSGSIADSLRNWASKEGLAGTALAAVYGAGTSIVDGAEANEPVRSSLPLNAAQQEVVRRARQEPVAVVSGPPGSGKSHAVVAAALEVVNRGGSVLLVTQSTHAADVLGDLLDRYPGPTPVLFGDAERRESFATELARGAGRGMDDATVRAGEAAMVAAAARARQLADAVDAALATELRAAELTVWQPLLPGLRADLPGVFAPDVDLARAEADLALATASPATGWRQRWRQWRATRRLRALLGALLGAGLAEPSDRVRAAIEAGRCVQAAAGLAAGGGTDLAATWQALHEAEAALAAAVGASMRRRAGSASRWDATARRTAAALASALRAGRNRRRQLLAGMDGAALVRALPLWVGTAADVGDLLPPVPGLFDLVILDEASHLDQLRAAPVLARAKRALVVGDPRQLRFVSFVADVDVTTTLRRLGLDERVDVRRVSAYDLAAGAAPVTWLDEHYRSVPHLIEFSADRFYDGKLTVATRHPANDSLDVIGVARVSGAKVVRGVNAAEVDAVLATVRQLAGAGVTGIAVVSPFRAQADALEAALIKEFSVAELERLGLRAGTVHAFQGSEAAAVVASLGLLDGDPAGRTRFVADPNLFNVLITRARERMIVVTSLTGQADGLIGEYLGFADRPPAAPVTGAPARGWTADLAGELRRAGLTVRADYPVGRWTVDLCAGDGPAACGLVTRVHPDGPAAHRRRQQALARAGWRLIDAYASRWSGDPVRAALHLIEDTKITGRPG